MKAKRQAAAELDFNSREALERFRKTAAAFTKRATRSKAAAKKLLVDEGIYTRAGKLSKQYS